MAKPEPVMPRQPAPALEVATLDGGTWRLAEARPENFTMVVVYRGLHCPQCKRYMTDLVGRLDDFAQRGVDAIAVSCDSQERARAAHDEWQLGALRIGYGLSFETARAWGLYLSSGRGKTSAGIEEPAIFAEPGLFLVRPDGTVFCAAVQSMPFARPPFDQLLSAVDFVLERGYPARGEVTDEEARAAAA